MKALAAMCFALGASLSGAEAFAQPITGIDPADATAQLRQMCAGDSSCVSKSIVAIPNRVGDASVCANSSIDNVMLTMSGPRLYYIYSYKNGCSFDVWVNLKIGNRWDENVGRIKRGAHVTVSAMYETMDGRQPSTIMLCRSAGGPKDDFSCRP